jgi:flavorubredoxin
MQVTYLAKLLKPPTKYASLIVLYAWGTNADRQLSDALKESGAEILDVIKINVTPTEDDIKKVKELVNKVLQKIKE